MPRHPPTRQAVAVLLLLLVSSATARPPPLTTPTTPPTTPPTSPSLVAVETSSGEPITISIIAIVSVCIVLATKVASSSATMDQLSMHNHLGEALQALSEELKNVRRVLDTLGEDRAYLLSLVGPSRRQAVEARMAKLLKASDKLDFATRVEDVNDDGAAHITDELFEEELQSITRSLTLDLVAHSSHVMGQAVPVVNLGLALAGVAKTLAQAAKGAYASDEGAEMKQQTAWARRQRSNLKLAFCRFVTQQVQMLDAALAQQDDDVDLDWAEFKKLMAEEFANLWLCRCSSEFKERQGGSMDITRDVVGFKAVLGADTPAPAAPFKVVESKTGNSELNPDEPNDDKTEGKLSPGHRAFSMRLFTKARGESQAKENSGPAYTDLVAVSIPCTSESEEKDGFTKVLEAEGYKVLVPTHGEAQQPASTHACHDSGDAADFNKGRDEDHPRVHLYSKRSFGDPIVDVRMVNGADTECDAGYERMPMSTNHNSVGTLSAWWNDYNKYAPHLCVKHGQRKLECPRATNAKWCVSRAADCRVLPVRKKLSFQDGFINGVRHKIQELKDNQADKEGKNTICHTRVAAIVEAANGDQTELRRHHLHGETDEIRKRKQKEWSDGCFEGHMQVAMLHLKKRHVPDESQFSVYRARPLQVRLPKDFVANTVPRQSNQHLAPDKR